MANKAARHRFFDEIREKRITSFYHFSGWLVLVVLFLLALAPDVSAARRRVIFQLANLHQWAELEYAYDGNGYGGEVDRRSQNHNFEEKYHLDIDYAILGSKLANGGLDLDLGFNQSYKDEGGRIDRNDSSEGFNLEYLFDMLLFEQASTPIALYSGLSHEKVNEPFTRSHDLINQHYSANLSLKNDYVPSFVNYHYSEVETFGLDLDRFQSSEELRFSSYIHVGELSTTDLHAETNRRETQIEGAALGTATDGYLLEANNVVNWTALSQRQVLRSSYRAKKETGTSELESNQWNERLRLRLGKALETELSHQYRRVETPRQFRREQESEAWVEHRLFRSLTNRYRHLINQTEFNTGKEESWQRQYNVAYNKALAAESRLRLGYGFTYGETDRRLEDRTIVIGAGNPEVKQIDNFFEVTLDNPDVVDGSIVVRDAFGIISPSNYSISSGRLVTLDFDSNTVGLAPGDEVLIEYDYDVNNSIEFATTTKSVSGSLGLFNQKYRIYANYSQSDQDLLSGEANVSSLIQQEYLRVGAEANLSDYALGGSYSYLNSTISTEEYVEAFLNYRKEKKGRAFSLRLIERFNSITQKEGVASDTSEKNSLMLHLNYRKQLARNSTATFKMFLADIRGNGIEKDEATFGLLFESRWYKFLFRLNADVRFEYNDGQNSHEEQLSVALRRYF